MTELNSIQKKILSLLEKNIDEPLSYRDLAREIDVSSTNTVAYHLGQLERKGVLKRDPFDPKKYIVLSDPETGVVPLNLFGLVHCGPRGSLIDGKPLDRVPVASRLIPFSASEAFLVKTKGDSMEPRIFEGDIVLVQHQNVAESGDIVVCINDEEALIKKMVKKDRQVFLVSLNAKYDPFLAAKDFRIEGIVKKIIMGTVS